MALEVMQRVALKMMADGNLGAVATKEFGFVWPYQIRENEQKAIAVVEVLGGVDGAREEMKAQYPDLFFDRETRRDRIGVADFIRKVCK